MKLISIHRVASIILSIFILAHLTNHLAIYAGEEMYIHVMDRLRLVYRNSVVEIILLACCTIQIVSGIGLLKKYNLRSISNRIKKLQIASGVYIGIFLLFHISAVLIGRTMIDTNLYFGATGIAIFPLNLFFIPYYFLGVFSVFTHVGCSLFFKSRSMYILPAMMISGIITALLIIIRMSGVDIPAANLELYNFILK